MMKMATAKAKKKVKQYGSSISLDLLSSTSTVVYTLSEGVFTVVFCKQSREGERKRENCTRSTINFQTTGLSVNMLYQV